MPLPFPLFLSMHLYVFVFICFFLRVLLALYAHFLFHIFFRLSVCFGLYLSLTIVSHLCEFATLRTTKISYSRTGARSRWEPLHRNINLQCKNAIFFDSDHII